MYLIRANKLGIDNNRNLSSILCIFSSCREQNLYTACHAYINLDDIVVQPYPWVRETVVSHIKFIPLRFEGQTEILNTTSRHSLILRRSTSCKSYNGDSRVSMLNIYCHYTALYCVILHYIKLHCILLHNILLYYIILLYSIIWYSIILYYVKQ